MTKKQILDAKTGITTVLDMTAEEEAQVVKDKASSDKEIADKIAADAKLASGKAKLKELGLDDDELKQLLGI